MKNKEITVSGKRKRAVATATIKEGTGKVTINKKSYKQLTFYRRLSVEEPLRIAEETLKETNYDISVNVKGGGKEGQSEASRLAIARAIVAFTKSQPLRKAYASYDKGLLVADVRRKEAYKPGDSKARRKRQKSYR
ncbi:30S ribosomal protein S9 [Candidatus Pacearchaeota archaeon CG10_big_fil_rev_8_21_14_0_10_35_13]|nr:MAG: 30S ribosomal protein S9 [Candidatus Pacearchaeota archaeon CG10_big_fil_rev_8_21_14_0_10_35_13]